MFSIDIEKQSFEGHCTDLAGVAIPVTPNRRMWGMEDSQTGRGSSGDSPASGS